jgi:AAA domain-containing protein
VSTEILQPTITLPDGWEETAEGMRTEDGEHEVTGFVAGCDPFGEHLILSFADGSPNIEERVAGDLHGQLAVCLRLAKLEADGGAVAQLATDLQIAVRSADESARESFYLKLAGGDLYKLLHQGIGPRHPWNVASVMRYGPKPRPMLLDEWLVAAELHWIAAEPGAGKTWFGLWLAWRVMAEGGIVVWSDEEVGVDTLAERLIALGANPGIVESNLIYFPYPGWQADSEDVERWNAVMKDARPSLVVIDTATDALAEAGMDENSGVEVTAWVKHYCEPPRQVGAAVLVLDHVVKAGVGASRSYAVGSRAKKAKAKVQYQFDTVSDYDPDSTGIVDVTLTKNGLGASIPKARTFKVGGDGEGCFLIEPAPPLEVANASGKPDKAEKRAGIRDRCEGVIREQGPISTGQIKSQVTGGAQAITEALAELAEGGLYAVAARKDGKSTVYEWTGD